MQVLPGEVWAYRARSQDDPVRVEVLRHGTKRPLRVCVRFLDDVFEGKEEWVPPVRLKVPWAGVESWLAEERRWEAVRAVSCHVRDTPEGDAAWLVYDYSPNVDAVRLGYNRDSGLMRILDVDAVVAVYGITREVLTADPLSFVSEDGVLVVPWPVTVQVVRRIAVRNADLLVAEMDREDAEARQEAIHGRYYPGRGGAQGIHIRPETCVETDLEDRPARDLVRVWCGQEANDRATELAALRAEVFRLGQLIEHAIDALARAGRTAEAAGLQRQLGVPVETLRRSDRRDHTLR